MTLLDRIFKFFGYEKESVAKELRRSNKKLQKQNQLLLVKNQNLMEDIVSLKHGLSASSRELANKENKLLANKRSLEMAKQFEEAKIEFFKGANR